jgi:hypothetical protein
VFNPSNIRLEHNELTTFNLESTVDTETLGWYTQGRDVQIKVDVPTSLGNVTPYVDLEKVGGLFFANVSIGESVTFDTPDFGDLESTTIVVGIISALLDVSFSSTFHVSVIDALDSTIVYAETDASIAISTQESVTPQILSVTFPDEDIELELDSPVVKVMNVTIDHVLLGNVSNGNQVALRVGVPASLSDILGTNPIRFSPNNGGGGETAGPNYAVMWDIDASSWASFNLFLSIEAVYQHMTVSDEFIVQLVYSNEISVVYAEVRVPFTMYTPSIM